MTKPRCSDATGRGLVRVSGRDARAFLHAQTTQAIDDLPADATRPAAWLNPQGRVRALFDVLADGDDFWLILPTDGRQTLIRDLGRYVLHADVALAIDADHAVHSLLGASDDWLGGQGLRLPAHAVARADGAVFVRIAPGLIEVIARRDAKPPALVGLDAAGPDAAARAAIAEGRAEITAAQSERYVAQMLDLDVLGAVSFTKGCYPGQEIVARIANRGAVKRRLRRFATAAGERPAPGDGIVDAAGATAGEVNRAAAAADEGFELLGVVDLDAAARPLALAADGRELRPRRLPGHDP